MEMNGGKEHWPKTEIFSGDTVAVPKKVLAEILELFRKLSCAADTQYAANLADLGIHLTEERLKGDAYMAEEGK